MILIMFLQKEKLLLIFCLGILTSKESDHSLI